MQVIAANAEHEAERFLLAVIPISPARNHAWIAGGYVRDQFMGKMPKDLDVMVEMRDGSEKLTNWLHNHFPEAISNPHQMGAGYPIWKIVFKDDVTFNDETYSTKGAELEFADSQKESFPDPNSRQRVTEFGTKEDDVRRRDLTVNMLLKDLTTGEVLDLTGVSKKDILEGIIRGHPEVDMENTFRSDPLRLLRMIRFSVKYGWKPTEDVMAAAQATADRLSIISEERIRDELIKIMSLGKTAVAVRLMKQTGMLAYVLPEIESLTDVMHDTIRGIHQEGSVLNHTLLVLENAKPTMEAQLAALLHDVGKPATQKFIGDKIMFIGHERVGGEMAEAVMRRLKFDAVTIKKVRKVVELHMRMHSLQDVKESKLRAFIREVGDEMIEALLDITEADTKGNLGTPPEALDRIQALRDRIKNLKDAPVPLSRKPVLNGDEIIEVLGVRRGPIIGDVIKYLMEVQDEYAERGVALTKEEAAAMIKEKFSPKTARRRMTMQREAGLKEVVQRIYKHIRDSDWAKSLVDKVTRFTQSHSPSDDLTPQEVSTLYHGVNLDTTIPISKKRKMDVEWSDHAKYRCHLRDVNPVDVDEAIKSVMEEKVQTNRLDRKKVNLRKPGVGTMVVDYDLTRNPSPVDVITVWAKAKDGEEKMDTMAIAKRVASSEIKAWGGHSTYR